MNYPNFIIDLNRIHQNRWVTFRPINVYILNGWWSFWFSITIIDLTNVWIMWLTDKMDIENIFSGLPLTITQSKLMKIGKNCLFIFSIHIGRQSCHIWCWLCCLVWKITMRMLRHLIVFASYIFPRCVQCSLNAILFIHQFRRCCCGAHLKIKKIWFNDTTPFR